MTRHAIALTATLLFCTACAAERQSEHAATALPPITEQYMMLYYEELAAPRRFYGELLGLEATFEDEWVSLYRLTPSSYVGVVKEGEGAYHRARPENAVMLSIVTEDVDAWYERLRAADEVPVLKAIYDSDSVPIRAFLVADPGGYTVEVFQWLER